MAEGLNGPKPMLKVRQQHSKVFPFFFFLEKKVSRQDSFHREIL